MTKSPATPPKDVPALSDVELAQELLRANRENASLRERLVRAESRADGFVRMTHEIRTLLGAVTGLSTILLDGELAGEQREHVKHIRASGAALLEVVNGVLDFGKLEAGKLAVEETPFDLRVKLEDVVALAAERASTKGLDLAVTLDEDVPTAVVGDGVRLRQALLNLVINAIKFTESGTVVLRASLAREGEGVLRTAPTDRALVRIDVADTGAGIPPSALRRIFEPFEQTGGVADRDGTGLGLSIVRGFVEAMGGTVSCTSELGVGSCFTATLPLRARDAEPSPSARPRGEARVLVVEALEPAREDLRRGIARAGFEVAVAADAAEALGAILPSGRGEPPFSAILFGVSPGQRSWVDEATELSSAAPDAKLVVATPFHLRLPERLASRAWAHVYKPYRRSRVVDALLAALDASHPRPEITRLGTPKLPLLEPGTFRRLTALVVEDEAINARITRHLLERRGWSVDHAVDGQDGVEHCARRSYDLVLLDWHTPRLEGLAAARLIREREAPGQRMPIVALTAVAVEGAREDCLAAGMDDFLTKPIIQADFDAVLARVVSGAYARRARTSDRPSAAPTVDEGVIDDLRGADPELLGEIVELFATTAPARFAALRESVLADDAAAATNAAHALRGSASQVGLARLAQRFADVELHAKATELRAIAPSMDALGEALDRGIAALRAVLQ